MAELDFTAFVSRGLTRSLVGALLFGALGACSTIFENASVAEQTGAPQNAVFNPSVTGGPASGPIDRLFLERCVGADDVETFGGVGLAAALLPKAISFGVGIVGSALTAAGKERIVQASAARRFEPDRVSVGATPPQVDEANTTSDGSTVGGVMVSSAAALETADVRAVGRHAQSDAAGIQLPACVYFVRGQFSPKSPEIGGELFRETGDLAEVDFVGQLRDIGIQLAERPDLFVQARLVTSDDESVYALELLHIAYNRRIDDRAESGERGLVLEYSLDSAAGSITGKSPRNGVLSLGVMQPGDEVRFAPKDARRPEALWTSGPNAAAGAPSPMVFEMRVLETRAKSPVLSTLGKFITENNAEIATALRQNFFPTAEEQAQAANSRDAQISELEGKVIAYFEARSAYEARLAALKPEQQAGDLELQSLRWRMQNREAAARSYAAAIGAFVPF